MPAATRRRKAERTIATGFLAIGPKTLNERNGTQFELDVADEQIDVTTQAFLGITVACARCHDHKFDPIPQKDYYALAGIFRSTETCYGTVRFIQSQRPSRPLRCRPGLRPAGRSSEKLTDAERKARSRSRSRTCNKQIAEATDPIRRIFPTAQAVAAAEPARRRSTPTATRSCWRWASATSQPSADGFAPKRGFGPGMVRPGGLAASAARRPSPTARSTTAASRTSPATTACPAARCR